MRKLLLGLLGASALAGATAANGQQAEITFDDAPAISGNNDFAGDLNTTYGLDNMAAGSDTDISLTADALLTFYYLGSESGYMDMFTAGSVMGVENNSDNFPGGILLGSDIFLAGSLMGQLLFSSSSGAPATIGDEGFGIFLPDDYVSGTGVTEFFIGYDDQLTNPDDDNHDDFLVRVTVGPAVPEPATWAMMLMGFGAAGYAMRRRRAPVLAQAA